MVCAIESIGIGRYEKGRGRLCVYVNVKLRLPEFDSARRASVIHNNYTVVENATFFW